MLTIFCIALGGALGALMRYSVTLFFTRFGLVFLPFGTLCVNLIGSFGIGLCTSYFLITGQSNTYVTQFLLIGLFGALTTFSTFAYDSYILWNNGQKKRAYLFVCLNLVGGMSLVFIGVVWPFLL